MELPSSTKRPPRSLSKQKSCGMILHSSQKGELSNNQRGCLTPNSKTTTSSTSQQRRLGLQHSASVKSKSELSKVSKNNLDGQKKHTAMSGSKRTPLSSKSRTGAGQTPKITPAGTRSPFSTMGSNKGKTKRDFERGRDDIRPKKRLAVSQEENDSGLLQNDGKASNGSSVNQSNHKNTIPVAEVKPLSVVRNLYGNDEDMEDGSSNEKSATALINGKTESYDLNDYHSLIYRSKGPGSLLHNEVIWVQIPQFWVFLSAVFAGVPLGSPPDILVYPGHFTEKVFLVNFPLLGGVSN